jgi:hypothetical protein
VQKSCAPKSASCRQDANFGTPQVLGDSYDFSTDSFARFLKELGKVDLLTAGQEVELAKRIERGDHRAKQEMVEAKVAPFLRETSGCRSPTVRARNFPENTAGRVGCLVPPARPVQTYRV